MNSVSSIFWVIISCVLVFGGIGWVAWQILKRSDSAPTLVVLWIATIVIGGGVLLFAVKANDPMTKLISVIVALLGGLALALMWTPVITEFVGAKVGNLFDGGNRQVDPTALYSIAQSRRKSGKYPEAIAEIHRQLAMFPNDFQGWMMLAEIYADDQHDLISAQDTIEQVLAQPAHTPVNTAYALNKMADWHLKLGQDIESACAALQRVIDLLPDTEEAQHARQRLAHMTTPEMLADKTERRKLVVTHYEGNVGLREDVPDLKPADEDPGAKAARLVKHLEAQPFDNEAREQLATIYAEHYNRIELAIDQYEQLIATPHQQQREIAHWLNAIADLYIKMSQDTAGAKATLERIIEKFPNSAAAENARTRMAHLKLELRPQQKSQVVKLGSYEQNLGLK